MADDGKAMTEAWIASHGVLDAAGRPHYPHGIMTCTARLMVYVLFDDSPLIGRRAFYFFTNALQNLARSRWSSKPIMGSRASVRTGNTGAGYLLAPSETFIDRVEWVDGDDDSHRAALAIVMTQLRERVGMGGVRRAKPDEERMGIDLVAYDPKRRYGDEKLTLEVKTRGKGQRQSELFLQVSETNPERRID